MINPFTHEAKWVHQATHSHPTYTQTEHPEAELVVT